MRGLCVLVWVRDAFAQSQPRGKVVHKSKPPSLIRLVLSLCLSPPPLAHMVGAVLFPRLMPPNGVCNRVETSALTCAERERERPRWTENCKSEGRDCCLGCACQQRRGERGVTVQSGFCG